MLSRNEVNYNLFCAVRKGKLETARDLINSYGLSYSQAWGYGYNLLRVALQKRHAAIVRLLLASGSRVNSKSSVSPDTPLHLAANYDDIEIVQMLLDRHASITSKNLYGETALHVAIINGKWNVIELLLNSRADVNAKNNGGRSLLHVAIEKGSLQTVQQLLQHGADVHAKDNNGLSLLHVAVQKGCLEIFKQLLQHGADVHAKDKNGLSLLHVTVKKGCLESFEHLLKYKADINVRDENGRSLLHVAVQKGCLQMFEHLLKYKADVNVRDNNGRSLLHVAVQNGCLKMFKQLFKSGVDVNAKDDDGLSSLHLAVEKKSLQVVEQLLKNGADINCACTSRNGYTPMHLAVKNGWKELITLLLSSGANVDVKGENSITPLQIAMKNNDLKITKLLLINGANIKDNPELLNIAVQEDRLEIVEIFLKHGAHINATDENGRTALHFTALLNEFTFNENFFNLHSNQGPDTNIKGEIAKLLLKKGAIVDAVTKNGETTLHAASENGSATVVQVLLKYNANLNLGIKTRNNLTPLHIATISGHTAVVRILLQHRAKVDNEDDDGNTILHLAVEQGHLMTVREILKFCPDINNESNRSAFKIAVHRYERKYKQIVMALEDYGFTVDPEDASNPVLFHAAVKNGYFNIVKELLKYGSDVNILHDSRLAEDLTPLHSAVVKKQEKVAKLLISYDADINAKDTTGKTPIVYAIENDDSKITKLLLNNGARVKDYSDLLSIAVQKKNIEIVKALLKQGVDVNVCDKDGKTALHFTAFSKHYTLFNDDEVNFNLTKNLKTDIKVKIAKLLLRHGANVDAQTENGETTLYFATKYGNAKVVEILLKYNANLNLGVKNDTTLLHISVERRNNEISTMLLNKGINVNAKQEDGNTALHIATQNGDQKIIESLLKFGSDINSRDECSRTALHIAAKNGLVKVVETLLDHGSDINIMCADKKTPLDHAIDAFTQYPSHQIATVETLKCCLVKMTTANLYVSEKNLMSIGISDEMTNFEGKCEEEIARMMCEQINNANISFYNVLTKSSRSLARYLKNENILQVFKRDEYKTKFPLYAGMIKNYFRRGMERNYLLKQGQKIFIFFFNNFHKLPYECAEEIFSYLSNEELRTFVYACKPLKIQLQFGSFK